MSLKKRRYRISVVDRIRTRGENFRLQYTNKLMAILIHSYSNSRNMAERLKLAAAVALSLLERSVGHNSEQNMPAADNLHNSS